MMIFMTLAIGSDPAPKSLQQWLAQGEMLYTAALKECQTIEAQILELESRLSARHAEANQIARLIGKPPLDSSRRPSAQLVTAHTQDTSARNTAQIARALSGATPARQPVPSREPAVLPPRS